MAYYSSYTFTPVVPFDAAAPKALSALADPAVVTTLLAYVYLLRVVDGPTPLMQPNAKIPTHALPAAEPAIDAAVSEPEAVFVSLEY